MDYLVNSLGGSCQNREQLHLFAPKWNLRIKQEYYFFFSSIIYIIPALSSQAKPNAQHRAPLFEHFMEEILPAMLSWCAF